MKHLILIISSIFLFHACNSKPDTEIETIVVDATNTDMKASTAAFQSFHYVILETTPESLLPDISKVLVNKDRIYVLPMQDSRVFIFSKAGKFIHSLQKGQGPGEVLFVSDMDIVDDELYVLDNYRVIHKYDADGNYLQDAYTSEDPYFSFKYNGDKLLLFNSYNKTSEYMLKEISEKGTKEYIPKDEKLKNEHFLYYNFCYNNYISWPMCNVIYQHTASSTEPRYRIRFQGKNFYDAKDDGDVEAGKVCDLNQDKSYYRWLKDVAEYQEGLYFAFNYDETYFVRYEKGKATVYNNLVEGLPKMTRAAVGCSDDEMVYLYMPEELLEYKENELSKQKKIKYPELFDQIQEDANPVLFFFNLDENL